MLKYITTMRPTERFKYLTTTYINCPTCNKNTRLWLFFNKENCTINKQCNACNRKQQKKDIMKIVMKVMNGEGYE